MAPGVMLPIHDLNECRRLTARKITIRPPRHESRESLRDLWPTLLRLPFPLYGHLVAFSSEYFATAFFFFLALSGEEAARSAQVAKMLPQPEIFQLLYSSLSQGFAFVVTSWAFFRVTSGLFNPAISIGMCLVHSMSWIRGAWVILAQFLGAMSGAGFVHAIFGPQFLIRVDLNEDRTAAEGFAIELFLTAAFVFLVFLLASDRDRHKGVLLAPIALGLVLFTVCLSGTLYTGCSLNPARAFAVSLVSHSFPGYHWIYWLGPVLGSVVAVGLYRLVRQMEVETADAKHRRVESGEDNIQRHGDSTAAETGHAGHRLDAVQEQDAEAGESKGECSGGRA